MNNLSLQALYLLVTMVPPYHHRSRWNLETRAVFDVPGQQHIEQLLRDEVELSDVKFFQRFFYAERMFVPHIRAELFSMIELDLNDYLCEVTNCDPMVLSQTVSQIEGLVINGLDAHSLGLVREKVEYAARTGNYFEPPRMFCN